MIHYNNTVIYYNNTEIYCDNTASNAHEGRVAAEGLSANLAAELEMVALHVGPKALLGAVLLITDVTLVVLLASVHVDVL